MSLIARTTAKKLGKGLPVGRLLLAGDVALLAGRHLRRLDRDELRRLGSLTRRFGAGHGTLEPAEREELHVLIAKLEPRLLFGTALRQLSPVPVPRRVLYGRRGSPARVAAKQLS